MSSLRHVMVANYIFDCNPLINFQTIFLAVLSHEANRRAGIRQYTSSALTFALRFFSGRTLRIEDTSSWLL